MGVTDKIKGFSSNMSQTVQTGVKTASHSLLHMGLRGISGFFIGFVLALISQELFQLGTFSLVFLTILFMSLIYSVLSKFSLFQIIIFDVICVLVGALLRMYILIAPL